MRFRVTGLRPWRWTSREQGPQYKCMAGIYKKGGGSHVDSAFAGVRWAEEPEPMKGFHLAGLAPLFHVAAALSPLIPAFHPPGAQGKGSLGGPILGEGRQGKTALWQHGLLGYTSSPSHLGWLHPPSCPVLINTS